jgi:D-alanyl-lipoteichoic acid acyltransferase DltB (MBOAT superfamily)
LLHYFTPDNFRWLVLLLASFFFYATLKAPHLIAVLLLITTITYFTGILIDRKKDPRTKQYLLWGGISANVLTLIILKYLPFITQNMNIVLNRILPGTTVPVSKTIIAIGTSYFIFQAISYLIDIYIKGETPEDHFGHFALYMSFFPKLLQGPIERGSDLLPQFKLPYIFNYDNVRSGMLLFAIGLVKKVVIADRLALMVNPVYDNIYAYKGFPLLLATYYYSLQIYFDFSGYTDMALGTAMIFNITLTQNFNNPYFATSIADFWRRWHISFSRWILEYIFKPLQMSWRNYGNWGIAAALMITFTVSGIWHGASWGFVFWGILHGTYLALSVFYRNTQKKLHKYIGISNKSIWLKICQCFITFNLVSVGWIFFRARSIDESLYLIKSIIYYVPVIICNTSLHDILAGKLNLSIGYGLYELSVAILVIVFILIHDIYVKQRLYNFKLINRWIYYYAIISIIMFLSVTNTKKDFIYLYF